MGLRIRLACVLPVLPLAAAACGTAAGVQAVLPPDASAPDASAPGVPDAATVPRATPVIDSGVPCVDGDYHVDVGPRVYDAGCGDASAPLARFIHCGGEDWFAPCMEVVACSGDASVVLRTEPTTTYGAGTYSGDARLTGDDGGTRFDLGTVHLETWPDAGGTVAGYYGMTTASGTFCVRRE